jgi:hypothetical protein
METTPKLKLRRFSLKEPGTFGRKLIVLALLILTPGLWGAIKGALTLRWPRAEATILDAELRRHSRPTDSTPRASDMWNSFSVYYRYEVANREYLGGNLEPYAFGMQNSAGAERMRDRYPVGSKARVAYDPADPEIAYLEPGPSSFSLVLVGVGTFIGLIGLRIRYLERRGIRRKKKKK